MPLRFLVCLGAAAFALTAAVAALAAAPASLVLSEDASGRVADASGTLWSGRTALAGGLIAAHEFAPVRSLSAGRLAFDVRVTGADTDFSFSAGLRPNSVRVLDLEGRADLSGLGALAGDAMAPCRGAVRLDLTEIVLARGLVEASGEASLTEVRCETGDAATLPALRITAQGERARLVTSEGAVLAELSTDGGRASLTLTEDGAALLAPGRTGPVTLEMEL
ncbi:MAG: type II secretion system protein N [Oceanicaulis sp.]